MSYVYISAFTANIAAFVSGTVLTWSSPELQKLKSSTDSPFDTPISSDQGSWIASFFPLGAVFGPFIFGYLADKIGRRYTLLISGLPFVICYLLMALSKEVWIFYVARFVIGLALGGVFTVIPMYVGEIADNNNRGALGSTMNVFLCSGLLFSYSLGPFVSVMAFNLVLAVFPVIFLMLFFCIGTESPHYYVSKQEDDLAKDVLQKIRGAGVNVNNELMMLQKKIKEDGEGGIIDIFRSKGLKKALCISMGLVFFQQFSGINAVLLFAQTIFQESGTSLKAEICSIIIGCVQFGTSFLTPLVADRLRRKTLLIISAVGMLVAEVPLGIYFYLDNQGYDVGSISFLPILCLIVYILTYNFGYGPLPWAVMGELFPNNVKSIASSITTGFCWFFGFLIAYFFQSISHGIGIGPCFLIFSGFCAVAIPFTMFIIIETKGKDLNEIQDELNR